MTTRTSPAPKPKVADPKEVLRVAAEWPDEYLDCRELGHHTKLWRYEKRGRNFERIVFCLRCKRNRYTLLSPHGEVLSERAPQYPEGYLTKGLGRIDGNGRKALRVERMRREGLKVKL